MRSVRARRVCAPLDHSFDRYHTCTHSDAMRTAARDFSVPQVNLRRPASALVECHDQSSTEPSGRRSYPMGLWKRVRSYERTYMPAWQPQPTNWCHGSPAGHLHGAYRPPMAAWLEMRAKMAISGVGSAEGHLPYTPTVPGSHRAGPCGPRGAPYGRTECGRSRRTQNESPVGGKGLTKKLADDTRRFTVGQS